MANWWEEYKVTTEPKAVEGDKWWEDAPLVSQAPVRPLQRQPEDLVPIVSRRETPIGRWGEMPGIKPTGLLSRLGKQLYNVLGPNLIRGVIKTALRVDPDAPGRIIEAQKAVLAGSAGPEEAERMRKSLERGRKRVEKLSPLYVSEAETLAEKGVDVIAGITGFVVQLAALKRAMPTAPPAVIWEVQNLATGGTPGMGGAMYGAFSVPGKIIKGITIPAKVGRLAA